MVVRRELQYIYGLHRYILDDHILTYEI